MNKKKNKKQKTNTLTQENANRTKRSGEKRKGEWWHSWELNLPESAEARSIGAFEFRGFFFTMVFTFHIRLSRIHCNPNDELFQCKYIGVTNHSMIGDYFWLAAYLFRLIWKVAYCRLIIEATFDSSNGQKPVTIWV